MVDKGFTGLPRFISEGILGNLVGSSPPTKGTASTPERIFRGLHLLVQSVGKTKNKYDEGQIVNRELQTIQSSLSQPNLSMVHIRDCLCRLAYCHMLGYDVSFGIIHAVKLAQQGAHIDKKTGYLACCLLMHRDHELILLLVNTLQKDIKSSNILDNLAGLSACSQLVPVEMIPSVLPLVLDKLKHSRELVRQKAVMCLYQFQLLAPDLLEHNQNEVMKMLFDKDPGVMAATVNIVQNCIHRNPEACLSFGETLISILKQISSHKMATMFEYQTVPFPWLQIQILQCLAKLASKHTSLCERLAPLLSEILQKTGIKEHIAFSILYECLQCVMCINPPKALQNEAVIHIQRFLLSHNPNLKFIGVKLLISLVQVNPEYSVNYQQLIVTSLESPDLGVQKKMHKLLFEIAHDSNVTVVCSKLMTQLQTSTDKFWRSEVITMMIQLVERFDTDLQWQIETIFSILQVGNDLVKGNIVIMVINLVKKKFLCNGADQRGQKLLVQKCVGVLVGNKPAAAALHISIRILGELCSFLKNMQDDKVISLFTRHLTNENQSFSVQSSIVTALQNLVVCGVVTCDTMATKINECFETELPVVIKQQMSVILEVCKSGLTLSYHDNPDTTLTFLDDVVTEDLENGGNPYIPSHLRGASSDKEMVSSILPDASMLEEASNSRRTRTESTTSSTKTAEESDNGLRLTGVKRVWGKQGRIDTQLTASTVGSTGSNATEDEIRQRELESALFSSFKKPLNEDDEADKNIAGFLLHSADTAGWRSLHSTVVGAKAEEQMRERDMCNTEIPVDNILDLENLHVGTVDLVPPSDEEANDKTVFSNAQSIYSGNESGCDMSISESGHTGSSKGIGGVESQRTENVTENCSMETDLDEALSAMLQNSDTKPEVLKEGMQKGQLESYGLFTEHLIGKLEASTSDRGSGLDPVEIASNDNKQGARNLVASIYEDDDIDEDESGLFLDGNTHKSIYSLDS